MEETSHDVSEAMDDLQESPEVMPDFESAAEANMPGMQESPEMVGNMESASPEPMTWPEEQPSDFATIGIDDPDQVFPNDLPAPQYEFEEPQFEQAGYFPRQFTPPSSEEGRLGMADLNFGKSDSIKSASFSDVGAGNLSARTHTSVRGPANRGLNDEKLARIQQNLKSAAYDAGGVNWKKLFRYHDKDNSGTISYDEFKNAIRKDAKQTYEVLDDKAMRQLFEMLDINGDADIDLDEFLSFFCPEQSLDEEDAALAKSEKDKKDNSYFAKVRLQTIIDSARQRHEGLRKRLRAAAYDKGEVNYIRLFKKFDKDNNGQMDLDEFMFCIRKEGKVPFDVMSDQDLMNLFKFIDTNGDGKVSFEQEFIKWLDPDHKGQQEKKAPKRDPAAIFQATSAMINQIKQRLRAAAYRQGGVDWKALFEYYDRDNSGEVDFDEFRSAIRRDAKVSPDHCSEEQLLMLFKAVDGNKDGKVQYDSEFLSWMETPMDPKEIAKIGKMFAKVPEPLPGMGGSKVKTMSEFIRARRTPKENVEELCVNSRIEELKALAQKQAEEIEQLRTDHARELQALHCDYDGLTDRLEKAGVVSGDELRRQYSSGDEMRKPAVSSFGNRNLRGPTGSAAPSESGLDSASWDQSLAFTEASQPGGGSRELFDLALPLMNPHSSKKAKARALGNLQHALENEGLNANLWKGKSTPLHGAVKSGNIDYVSLLLEYGADPNTKDEQGVSVLHMATYEGQLDLCILLMDNFADPNNVDQYNQPPMFFAPTRNLCELLFQRHADTNLVNVEGQTALHLAGKAGFEDVLIWLSRHMPRSILDLRDSVGKRGWDYAIESNVNPIIFKRLFQWEPNREKHISSKDVILRPKKPQESNYDGEDSEEDEMLCRLTLQAVKQKLKAAAFWRGGLDWKKLFENHDEDGTGVLTFDQFLSCIRDGANISQEMLSDKGLRQLFNSVDVDGDGNIDYLHEFLPWLAPEQCVEVEEEEDEVRVMNTSEGKVFMVGSKRFTADQLKHRLRTAAYDNGTVNWRKVFKSAMNDEAEMDFEKFRIIMRKHARINTVQMPDAVLAALFNVVDVDGGGTINYEEELLPWLESELDQTKLGLKTALDERVATNVKNARARRLQEERERIDRFVYQAKERLKTAAFHNGTVNWKKLFRYYDRDNSGEINFEEFYAALRKSAKITHLMLSDSDIRILFDSVDTDKGGTIHYETEFLPWIAEDDLEEALKRDTDTGVALKGTAAIVAKRFETQQKAREKRKRAEVKGKFDAVARQVRERLKVAAYHKGVTNWERMFAQHDQDNSGEISFEEFRNAVRKHAKITPGQLTDTQLQNLFSSVDSSGGGTISFKEEFMPWLEEEQEEAKQAKEAHRKYAQKMNKTLKERDEQQNQEFQKKVRQARERMRVATYHNGSMKIQKMFLKYDKDASGEVDFEEFKLAIRKVAKVPHTMLTDDDLQALFTSLDTDGGGAVDYEHEFAEWLLKDPEEAMVNIQRFRKKK